MQVFIHNTYESGFLELGTTSSLEVENQLPVFTEDLSTGEFTLPIDIPWTEHNRRLLGFAEVVENFKKDNPFWECTVYDNFWPVMQKAKLTALEKTGDFNYNNGSFSASISGAQGLFGSIIKNKYLADLAMGGPITYTTNSRTFATSLVQGGQPQYNYISFAPIAIENFFNESKNYYGEFLFEDTVNNIVSTGAGEDDWQFATPQSTGGAPTTPGQIEYIDHRSIPFFNFKYVVQQCFHEHGFKVSGALFNSTDWDKLYIFNTTALEKYTPANIDITRRIDPKDHLPAMQVKDFLIAAFKFLNCYPVFYGDNTVQLYFRKDLLRQKRILDISARVENRFAARYNENTPEKGYTLAYNWDDNDDYRNDRVKELEGKSIRLTVMNYSELPAVQPAEPYTTDDLIFVENENMYYILANGTTTPILWDAYAEGLHEVVIGKGEESIDTGMATLCTYVEQHLAEARYIRRNKLGARMHGSYWNSKQTMIRNPFGLRVFFISETVVSGNKVPTSHNHNVGPTGVDLTKYSLALNPPKGLHNQLFRDWMAIRQRPEALTVRVLADQKLMEDLQQHEVLQIDSIMYLPRKINSQVPLGHTIEMELVPL